MSTNQSARTRPPGNIGLMAPTIVVEDAVEEITVDGVRMIFHNTPGTEAPAEMNTYLPDLKALMDGRERDRHHPQYLYAARRP